MSINFMLPARQESHSRWEVNRTINEMISKAFRNSISEEISIDIKTPCCIYEMVCTSAKCYADIPYASSTLEKSGCAVACMHHGLLSRGIEIFIEDVANEMAQKGYYEPGKGTYHNVFDHYGLRRATHIQEVFDAIGTKFDSVVTMLMDNSKYNGRNGNHFVNVIYYNQNTKKFTVCDPAKGDEIEVPLETILNSVLIAWIW